MKYLNGKLVMRGDAVIAAIDDKGTVVAGEVHEVYDRDNSIRIKGYALRVQAATAVLAADAYASVPEVIEAKKPKAEPQQPETGTPGA